MMFSSNFILNELIIVTLKPVLLEYRNNVLTTGTRPMKYLKIKVATKTLLNYKRKFRNARNMIPKRLYEN